jgi:mono/diheme cytochrome c family protein
MLGERVRRLVLASGTTLAFALLQATPARGQAAKASVPSFERDVLPILSANCSKCHGAGKIEAGLDLRTLRGMLEGGDNGAVLVRGDASRSLLFQKVSKGEMPPGKAKLSEAQVRLVRDWINAGAPSAQSSGASSAESQRDRHWAFRPLAHPRIPHVRHGQQVRTPVDAFLLVKLEAKGLTLSPDAPRGTLLRRAYFDLLGLPPSPEELDAFLADERPDVYERLLDRLLASPHFGQRWGRHWLDVAGYTDTVGFDQDTQTIIQSEGKWRYRDYVIAAFNDDVPYDRFVTEQLAGDELVDWRRAPRFTPEIRRLLTATGYLRTARDQTHEPESNVAPNHFNVLHDTLAIVGSGLLGLTLQCAQCHSHKFDPIPQRDYYQLMALFTAAYNPRDWRPVYPWKPEIKDRGLPDASPAELAELERHNRDVERQLAELKKRLARLRESYERRLREARLQKLPEPIRADTQAAVDTEAEKRSEVQKYLAAKFEALLKVAPAEVTAALSPADEAEADRLNAQITAVSATRRGFEKIQALYDVGTPPATYLLKRGNHETPGEEVRPGFLSALGEPDQVSLAFASSPAGNTSGRRLALARWLTEPGSRASALLARVMVNRLWQHLFGKGLVPTAENFGRSGEPPTHPELLEWLSGEFVHRGWRVKPLLRLMMTSAAYRQSSLPEEGKGFRVQGSESQILNPEPRTLNPFPEPRTLNPLAADPDNRLLSRMRLRRLEAEAIRDAILSVSGQLDLTMGGPPVLVRSRPDGLVEIDDKASPAARARRSVYLLCRRSYNLSLMTVFDQPLVAHNCPKRDVSAVPLQSLSMLNDAFVAEQARHFADRVARAPQVRALAEPVAHEEAAIRTAFRLALGRDPTAAEKDICTRLLKRQAAAYREAGQSAEQAQRHALVSLCHTLLNTSEFLYVE